MKIIIVTADEQIISFEVNCHESIENLRAVLEFETGTPFQRQQLLYNGRELSNCDKLSDIGVGDEDLILTVSSTSSVYYRFGEPGNQVGCDPSGSAANFQATGPQFPGYSGLADQLYQACLNADPLDVGSQQRIEAAIHQKVNGKDKVASSSEKNPKAAGKRVPEPKPERASSSDSLEDEVEQCLIDTLINAQEEFQLSNEDIQNPRKRSRVLQELISREQELWRAEEEEKCRLDREARRLEAQVQHMMAEHDQLEQVSTELEKELKEEHRKTQELREQMHKHEEIEAAAQATRMQLEAYLQKMKDSEAGPSKNSKGGDSQSDSD